MCTRRYRSSIAESMPIRQLKRCFTPRPKPRLRRKEILNRCLYRQVKRRKKMASNALKGRGKQSVVGLAKVPELKQDRASEVQLSVQPEDPSISVGETQKFIVTDSELSSKNPTAVAVVWNSSDLTVATIDSDTGIATGRGVGVATISAAS